MKKIILLLTLLMVLGVNAANAEDIDSELQQLQQALAKNPDDAFLLNETAVALYKISRYTEAELLYLRGLEIYEKALGQNHPYVASSLNNLAALYYAQGKYKQAEPLYLRSLMISEESLDKYHPDIAGSLNNLALCYKKQGKYEQAEPLYLKSLVINEKSFGKYHPIVATSLNNLAELYETQGKYKLAEPLHQRSLEIREKTLGKNHSDVAQSLNNLAWLYQIQGKYSQAEPLYQRSLSIWEKTLGNNHPSFATTLNNLAELYKIQGKYEQAEPLYQQSLFIREKSLGKEHLDVAQSLNNLGSFYSLHGKYEQAESMYSRSIAIKEKALGKYHPDITISLDNLAVMYERQGEYNKIEPLYQKSLRLMNKSLDSWLWGASEKTRQFYLQKEEPRRNNYLTFYSLRNTAEEAFYFSLSRKGLLLRISSEISALAKQSTNHVIQKQIQEFKTVRNQLSNLAFSGKADKQTIQDLEEKGNNFEMELSQNVSSFKRSKTEVIPEQVLEKLNHEETIIDFLVYTEVDLKTLRHNTDQVIALIVDKQNGIKLIKLGEFSPIASAIKTYQSTIVPTKENANSREQIISQTAQTLYQQLWQPLTPYLQNKKTVYLIPDGDLHLLPFKALQDPDGKYLAEKWQLITLSSARDIVLPPLEGKSTPAAIFAAPDYGNEKLADIACKTRAVDAKNLYFCPLAGALKEGQQIDNLFKEKSPDFSLAEPFIQEKATEKNIAALIAPKILHIATHGFFLENKPPSEKDLAQERGLMRSLNETLPAGKIDNPLTRSGLAFVNANLGIKGTLQNDGSDGILTALEVLNLDLAGTDLVTLSACNTGKGEVKIGEGVYSLNRAFQEAGAKAVLSTLWSVADEATGLFMQRFYNYFLNGEPAQQAIQKTQNEFMHYKFLKGEPVERTTLNAQDYSQPYYWAGFVMIGKE